MLKASIEGQLNIIFPLLEKGACNYSDCMVAGTGGGHLKVVELMLKERATKDRSCMELAITHGRMDIAVSIRYVVDNTITVCAASAASKGYLDIFLLMLQQGATYYGECMIYASGVVTWS